MSEPTAIDAEHEEIHSTLESRVVYLEQMTKQLVEEHKNVLVHLREAILAVTEISGESSEE
tara:strand:+ start:127 stop:309 length:183 start_codon:yes stop_codon:yes gene_type:complete